MTVPAMIDTEVRGVPLARTPVLWDRDETVETNMAVLHRWMAYYRDRLPNFVQIDEAAIMVPSPWHVEDLGRDLRGAGWEWFNSATDLVYTNPFGTRYFVDYNFFRMKDIPYRLEVMCMSEGRMDGESGFSPLHAALWPNGTVPNSAGVRTFPVPHLSFKPKRRVLRGDDYHDGGKQTWGNAYSHCVQELQAKGFIHAQTCQSTYGKFGYYIHQDCPKQIYAKPRINTRDEA